MDVYYSNVSVPVITVAHLQFSEIMDKISAYSGKQRKNSEGKCDPCACFPLKYV